MVSTNDIRPGQSILVDGIIYQIIEYQHVKPGKGKAFVKTKLKNLTNGGVLDKTFRADEDVEQAYIDKQTFQYSSVLFFDAGSNTSCGYRVRYSCENSNGMYVNRPHGSDGGYNTNTSMSTLLVLEMGE